MKKRSFLLAGELSHMGVAPSCSAAVRGCARYNFWMSNVHHTRLACTHINTAFSQLISWVCEADIYKKK